MFKKSNKRVCLKQIDNQLTSLNMHIFFQKQIENND